jgi:hypothetical protein
LICDDDNRLQTREVGSNSSIACDACFLVCQPVTDLSCPNCPPGSTNQLQFAPLGETSAIQCDAQFIICQNDQLVRASLTTIAELSCDQSFVVCDVNGNLAQAPIGSATSVPCDVELLFCQDGQVVAAPFTGVGDCDRDFELLICQPLEEGGPSFLQTLPVDIAVDILQCDSSFLTCTNGLPQMREFGTSANIPCSAEFLTCQEDNRIRRAPVLDASCTVLDCESDSFLVCAGGSVASKRLDYFLPYACDGTFTAPGDPSPSTFVLSITAADFPLVSGCRYRVDLGLAAISTTAFAVNEISSEPPFTQPPFPIPSGLSGRLFNYTLFLDSVDATLCDLGSLEITVTMQRTTPASFTGQYLINVQPIGQLTCNSSLTSVVDLG